MTSPCPRCGETKTDPVRHGAMYKLVWAFGYRLHRCSRCRRPRFIPRHHGKSPGSSQLGKEPANAAGFAEERRALGTAEARPEPKKDQVTAADSSDRGLRRCPACGSTEYHRTHRTKLERLLLRPRRARCEKCRMRFPYPRHHDEPSDAVKSGEAAATVPRSAEERKAPGMAEESSGPKVTQQVTVVDYSDHGLRRCPACGSSDYDRARRTILERILLRPRMARCRKCRKRFPYPRHHHKSPESVKSGEAAATVPRSAEERRAPGMAEESSQPKIDKQGTAADSSNRGLRCCPACGSTEYRRSRRTTLEKILLRPRMARCRNCRKRFPYPKQ
jgi:hypothetical protein